jgi:hypothetical protein
MTLSADSAHFYATQEGFLMAPWSHLGLLRKRIEHRRLSNATLVLFPVFLR